MLKIPVLLWMLLTIIIISLPIGIASFFFSRKILKKFTHVLGKIDTFDALTTFKNDAVHLYRTKFTALCSRVTKEKIITMQHNEQEFLNTIEDIIKPATHHSKHFDNALMIDEEEDKTTLIKKRKLLEKIIYDAL